MTHDFASFHRVMCDRLNFNGFYHYMILIMFREAAKTAWAKIFVLWCICYGKKHYIKYICFDEKKAKGHLYDIAIELQSNERILEDFGSLFFEGEFEDDGDDTSEKKAIGEFITSNKIRVQAGSTGISTRGDVFGPYRPDLYILDDFETDKTKGSIPRTREVINFIDELLGGISVDCNIIFLCNRISRHGSVKYLENKALSNPNWKKLEVRLESRVEKKIAWPSKYVRTDAEAHAINATREDPKTHVVSIESKKRDLGTARYEQEMNNTPVDDADSRYKPLWISKNQYVSTPALTQMDVVMAVDPNAGQSELADFMGICVLGRDRNTKLRYVLAMYALKLTIDQQLIKLKEIYDQWNPAHIGIEVVRSQRALFELAKSKHHFRLRELNPEGQDKITRSSYVEPLVENGTIKFNPNHTAFHDELLAFPFGDHDDMVDAFVYANQMLDGFGRSGLSKNKSPGITAGIRDMKF